jgi:hypothetical protein
MLEIGLPFGLGVEVDALYQRVGYRTAVGNFAGSYAARERANSWEVPVLLKYRLPARIIHPYVAGGIAPRTINGSVDSSSVSINLMNGQETFSTAHAGTNWTNSLGIVAGGGVQLGVGAFRLSPEVRYTYWNSTPINVSGPQGYGFQSAQNQVDVLVGISWKVH